MTWTAVTSSTNQLVLDRGSANIMEGYQTYTEVGFLIHNTRFSIKIPNIRLRRPRFWRKKQRITSTSMTSSNSSSSFSYASSDDWIRDFHARYNPLNTSTPIRDLRRQTTIISPSYKNIVQSNFPFCNNLSLRRRHCITLYCLLFRNNYYLVQVLTTTIIELIKLYWRLSRAELSPL